MKVNGRFLCLVSLLSLPLYASDRVDIKENSKETKDIELGAKLGYSIYSNQYNSPSSFGVGGYVKKGLTESLSFEGAAILLGKGEEANNNTGGFHLLELSAVYDIHTFDAQSVFIKAGLAPWFGYMESTQEKRSYDSGLSPAFGLGYTLPFSATYFARLEYQYFPDIGGDHIGYADTHFMSLGIGWRPTSPQPIVVEPRPVASDYFDSRLSSAIFFDNDSAQLNHDQLSKSVSAIDTSLCQVSKLAITGYADAPGNESYNLTLSQARAEAVAEHLIGLLGDVAEVSVMAFGSEKVEQGSVTSDVYERRVDVDLHYQCKQKQPEAK